TRGISLFVVPKWLPPEAAGGVAGVRNDIVLAGLNHKLGWRGTPNTVLNFGEGRHAVGGAAGAVGWLVGAPGDGLRCMFHMMNEARIGIGMAAAMLGMAGYEASLIYARQRRQGRSPGRRGDTQAAPIIEHADVRRMLLAQKAYSEGALALGLYCARLVDDTRTAGSDEASEAQALLDLLTPVAKSWPSQWCLEANSLAIQVHGGYGYTRDFPVEQYWRDNRLNMIHEGTHGIQALDLLGRKVLHDDGAALHALIERMRGAAARAAAVAVHADAALPWRAWAEALNQACAELARSAQAAARQSAPQVLDHATPFLQGFGHVVLAWIWLDVALCAWGALRASDSPHALLLGKLAACRYFFAYELPLAQAWLQPLQRGDATLRETAPEWL
ncbi:MAG: acyl-CoA dehydrogenase, partial [Betaproteobacteria bacterium]|nr:acyl-CoA dehydrogenase [Betaproteobacteria bacterium]